MASFFQPIAYDPKTSLTEITDDQTPSQFLIYTNSILSRRELFATWSQFLLLLLGLGAFSLPLLRIAKVYIFSRFLWNWRNRKSKKGGFELVASSEEDAADYEEVPTLPLQEIRLTNTSCLASVKSFGYMRQPDGNVKEFLGLPYDIHIVPIHFLFEINEKRYSGAGKKSFGVSILQKVRMSTNTWIAVEEDGFPVLDAQKSDPGTLSQWLSAFCVENGINGVVIDSKVLLRPRFSNLLQHLAGQNLNAILSTDASHPVEVVDQSLICGKIYQNACILPNGLRRDFFQAAKLRSSLSRAAQARQVNSNFFIGFNDLWDSPPTPAVIRRSHKLSSFNGAILTHGPATAADDPPSQICLGAFDWLKRDEIVQAQRNWVESLRPDTSNLEKDSFPCNAIKELEDLVPGITRSFDLVIPNTLEGSAEDGGQVKPPDLNKAPPRLDFWNVSSQGKTMCSKGCYDLREEVFDEQYNAILAAQEHLDRINMLQELHNRDLIKVLETLDAYVTLEMDGYNLIAELVDKLRTGDVRILQGLNSGFTLPDCTGHFWAVSRQKNNTEEVTIYMSLDAPDIVTTIVHCYLAHIEVPRQHRLEIEMEILRSKGKGIHMHPRIANELSSATYSELLFLLEQLSITPIKHPILDGVLRKCETLLIEEPTRLAYVKMHSEELLANRSSIRDALEIRLGQLTSQNLDLIPNIDTLVRIYTVIDDAVLEALLKNSESQLGLLSAPVLKAYSVKSESFEISSDLYALFFFCSLRRRAYEEVYMETTDRCPLFLRHDQAAVFAELWMLGSQCEIYFGFKPRVLGRIIYDDYRDYLKVFSPPVDSWNGTDVFTAYYKIQDEENKIGGPESPWIETVRANLVMASFLSIFCVPAMVDVGLLTFLGRGLFLTAFMKPYEVLMANYAILSSLLITAGVTGWSGSTGGFYLYQSAYINMNHFMVHSLSGGFMITLLLALCGFVIFGFEYSWYAGSLFAIYLIALTTYLNLLGVMATMHREGAPFTSGRQVLGKCLLITLISPLVTTFINGYDIIVYLVVIYVFLGVLIYNFIHLLKGWGDWPEKIVVPKEQEIVNWYKEKLAPMSGVPEEAPLSSDDAKLQFQNASAALMTAIEVWQKSSKFKDPFVEKLAVGHKYAMWLLKKESDGQPLPIPYSGTWLVQTKLALANQQQLDRGLKEHSPFLLFRNAKYDLAQNVGLFLIALMDRWVSISMSANGHASSMYYNSRARYGVAFGLLYFLLCAVSLDVVLQQYWGQTGRQSSERLGNVFDFESTEEVESRREKRRWLRALMELFWIMVGIFGLMTIFLWLFVIDHKQIILFLAYAVGYSSVIIFQFNRVFTMDIKRHVQIVFMAAAAGYIIGIILSEIPITQGFYYNEVISLCCSSISAAFGTWLNSDFCDDASREVHVETKEATAWKLYSQKLIGTQRAVSTLTTADLQKFEGTEYSYHDETPITYGIKQVLAEGIISTDPMIPDVLPLAKQVLRSARELWSKKRLRIVTVSREKFLSVGSDDIVSGCYKEEGIVTVVVGIPDKPSWKNVSEENFNETAAKIVAEAILYQFGTAMMLMSHADATLLELLLNPKEIVSTRMLVQFAWASTSELRRIASNTNSELLRHLALGCDMDIEWETTPEDVRKAVVSRATGRQFKKNKTLTKWLETRSCQLETQDLHISQCLAIHDAVSWRLRLHDGAGMRSEEVFVTARQWKLLPAETNLSISQMAVRVLWDMYDAVFLFLMFFANISRAGSDCGRELWFTLSSSYLQPLLVWVLLKIWKLCLWSKNFWVRTILLSKNTTYKQYHKWLTRGAIRKLTYGLVVEFHPRGTRSGFLCHSTRGFNLRIYDGTYDTEPTNAKHISATYDKQGRLCQLAHVDMKASKINYSIYCMYSYELGKNIRFPTRRTIYHENPSQDCHETYDEHGRIVSGECLKNETRFRFVYEYAEKLSEGSANVLSATYTSIDLNDPTVIQVYWCLPSPVLKNVQIPSERVQSLVKTTSGLVEEISWSYDHKRDPILRRKVRSSASNVYTNVEALYAFKDDFGMLIKPLTTYFTDENLLQFFKVSVIERYAADPTFTAQNKEEELEGVKPRRIRWPTFHRRTRSVTSISKLPTAVLRCSLWKQWINSTNLDAISACLIDEMILRKEPLLKKYWSLRDAGRFAKAKQYLEAHLESIVSEIELSDEISQKVNLAIKPADLFSMGLSKDANFIISRPEQSYIDTDNRLAVIFTDTGCWPDAPGGVSNCRRDLIEGHTTIRNYALTESANEYGIPRFQFERNVQLIKNLPLWGLDGKSPTHGLYENLLQSQVETRIRTTRVKEDIVGIFIPLLMGWVRGCRTHRLSKENLAELTDIILNINSYFEENDYLTTWKSREVRKAWREAWLCEYSSPNISNPNDSFDIERPTAANFDAALDLYISYFFIFSIRVPEHVPRVYQSTHHGISSLYGMILKIRRGTTWGIWDHAIMLRESLLNISPAQCLLPIAVQSMLIGAMKVAAHLAYTHADIILPCTAIYNPTWEAEIGSDQGLRSNSKIFQRKIDPITNGISSMDKFKPVGKPRTTSPTVIMLSNVQFIKDVKNAIVAAGVIINDFGFKDYHLTVYGAQDRQPSYFIETEKMIADMGIGGTVKLGGFGSPSQVLKDAWLFMNSSLSEGLPLAIGEAALSGVPIVATEVGATAQVLTDADDPNVLYGEIVPPNDPVALARAQVQLLAMLGPWAKYTSDAVPPPPLPSRFTPEDVEWISARMHEKADDRQALGLKLRDVVLRKFNGDRYLREHEQMYWVQRHMARQRADEKLEQFKYSHPRFGVEAKQMMVEPPPSTLLKGRWQDFDRKSLI